MTTSDLPPEREEQVISELLRERSGIDPGKVGPVLDLAAIGLVNGAWRNTCVENWHAAGHMTDGDMLWLNGHATWRVRQLVRRWMKEVGLDAAMPVSAFDGIDAEDAWWLAGRLYRWLINPDRKLPTGVTFAQLAGDGLPEYEGDADQRLSEFGAQAEEYGVRFGFVRTAAHGGLACSHWWGHPHWPARVGRFMTALANPADDHWGAEGQFRLAVSREPPDVADREFLHRLLLSRPWDLSADAAQWLIRAGIRYVKVDSANLRGLPEFAGKLCGDRERVPFPGKY
jgi:hypothetical protein